MNKKIKSIIIIVFIIAILCVTRFLVNQEFSSVEDFQNYIAGFGVAGPLVLTVFQALQVIIPVLPGYLGCAAGAVSFGTVTGFICNYIGITSGSIISYFLARKYGMRIILTMFSEKKFMHWKNKIEKFRSYDLFLFITTLLPLFPDDFLCYFSGLTKMKPKRFIWIIILGKPWCILAYSIIFGLIK